MSTETESHRWYYTSFQLSVEGRCNCSLQGFTGAHFVFFPVKNIFDKLQPDDMRFIQDFQVVNAAVQQCAPSVPNS